MALYLVSLYPPHLPRAWGCPAGQAPWTRGGSGYPPPPDAVAYRTVDRGGLLTGFPVRALAAGGSTSGVERHAPEVSGLSDLAEARSGGLTATPAVARCSGSPLPCHPLTCRQWHPAAVCHTRRARRRRRAVLRRARGPLTGLATASAVGRRTRSPRPSSSRPSNPFRPPCRPSLPPGRRPTGPACRLRPASPRSLPSLATGGWGWLSGSSRTRLAVRRTPRLC